MRLKIRDEMIELDNKEVQAAKTMIANFISKVRKESYEKNEPTFFFTSLLIMHLMSQEALNKLDPKDFSIMMKSITQSFGDSKEKSE